MSQKELLIEAIVYLVTSLIIMGARALRVYNHPETKERNEWVDNWSWTIMGMAIIRFTDYFWFVPC